jgi:NADPH:quinone reductase-like Zn-dependent oxidoreductase
MKVFEISDSFGIDHLKFAERERSDLDPDQIRIAMRAASLNYRDWLMVTGKYNPRQPLPLVPCSDGVGIVIEVGPKVSRFKRGDRVLPIFAQSWHDGKPTQERIRSTLGGPLDGVLAEQMVIDSDSAVHAPDYLSDSEAATLPCAAVTAWNALVVHGELAPGDRVLVQGSGGVAIFALQLATALGAEVIALSSRNDRHPRLRQLGAIETINYKEDPSWGKTVRKQFGGVDLVVDVGGATTLPQSLAATRVGGRICQVGNLGGGSVEINLISLFMQQIRLQGILVGDRASFESLCNFLSEKKIRPVIDRVYDWGEAGRALSELAAGEQFGKICLTIEEGDA